MSATENSEFAVPEVVAENEKEESKEIKATKRPADVSTTENIFFKKKFHQIFPRRFFSIRCHHIINIDIFRASKMFPFQAERWC